MFGMLVMSRLKYVLAYDYHTAVYAFSELSVSFVCSVVPILKIHCNMYIGTWITLQIVGNQKGERLSLHICVKFASNKM